MKGKAKRISMSASRFHELRWHVWNAWNLKGIGPSIFFVFALAFLSINIAWTYIPVLRQVRLNPYLELEIRQQDGVFIIPKITQRGSDYDCSTINPEIEIAGYYKGYSLTNQMVDFSFVTKVDGNIVSTKRIIQQLQVGNYAWPVNLQIPLSNPGIHRVEVQLNTDNNIGEERELDIVAFSIKREKVTPTKPIIVGVQQIDDSTYSIRGIADPNVLVIFGNGTGEFYNAYGSDNWGYFIGQFQNSDSSNTQIQIHSQNSAAYSKNVHATSEPAILDLSDFSGGNFVLQQETNLILSLGYEHFAPKIQVKMRRDDPVFSDLLSGRTTNEAFLSNKIGGLIVNNSSRMGFFKQQAKIKTANEKEAEVNLDYSSFYTSDFNYFGDSDVQIRFPNGFPLPGNTGKFQIQFEDNQKYSVQTKPDMIDGNIYTWNQVKPEQIIKVRLQRGNFALSLRGLGSLSYYEVSGSNDAFESLLRFGMQFFKSLPLLGIIWLIYSSRKLIYPKSTFMYARRIVLLGLEILYIPTFYGLINYGVLTGIYIKIQELFHVTYKNIPEPFNLITASLLTYTYDFSSVIILLVGIIIVEIAQIFFKIRRKYHIVNIFLAISKALSFLIAIELSWIVLSATQDFFMENNFDIFSMMSTAFVCGVVIYTLIRSSINSVQTLRNKFDSSKNQSKAFLVFLVLFSISVFLAIENFSVFNDPFSNIYSLSTYRVQNILSKLGGLIIPYTFLAIIFIAVDIGRRVPWKTVVATKNSPKILLKLNSLDGWSRLELNYVQLGQIVFAGFIVGTNDNLIIFPISLLVAWFVYKNFLLSKPYDISRIAYYEKLVRTKRSELLVQLVNDLAIVKLQKKKDETFVNLAGGKINPSEQEKIILTLDGEIQALEKSDPTPIGIRVKDIVLAFGPYEKPLKNAVFGIKVAFFLQIPLLFIFIQYYLFEKIYAGTAHLGLILLSQLIIFVCKWLIWGFFFGFLYEFIRGNNGLRKSLFLAGAYALSLLPYRLITAGSAADFSSFTFEIGQTAIFLICLGLMFDWETLKNNGYHFSYLQVVISDIPSLLSVSSILLTTLTVVITSLLSGQLSQLLGAVLGSILPTVTNLPFPPGK